MNANLVRNNQFLIDQWSPEVAQAYEDIKMYKKYGPTVDWHVRSNLRIYGFCLAQARERLEMAKGIENPTRRAAADKYFQVSQKAYEMLERMNNEASTVDSWSYPDKSYEERLEELNVIADEALLHWCAE